MTPGRWVLACLRGIPVILLCAIGLGLMLLLRLIERPLFGLRRPVTPYITQAVCRTGLRIFGLKLNIQGRPSIKRGAFVANHSSWLDIFLLNASKRMYFVAKAEVAGWAGIGWLAQATGTVFIKRNRQEAARQKRVFEARLKAGHRLLFFPEGTSTDGMRVLGFKPTLFAAFFEPELRDITELQAISVTYHPPQGYDERIYGWWGDMDFSPHLLTTLSLQPQGHIDVVYHPPVKVTDFADRKALSLHLETQVRSGMTKPLLD
ncbi:lysophospholipid acyltransferase family protein [Algirhabdus cladophorae]|uniref:lysophospholipid acyltransferase family protein n=1 Tax=Algirhabdus cladophorae TaxID=3377108 RepID=UPI003B8498B6